MYKGGAVALVIEKSLNGSFLFSIFCIKLAIIFSFFVFPENRCTLKSYFAIADKFILNN